VRDGQFLLEWPGYCSKKAYRTQAKGASEAIIEKDLQDYEDACHGHISYLPDLCFRLRWIRRIEKMLDGCSLVHLQKEKGCRDGQMVSHHMNRTEW
jgi:hypothetical protein